MTKRKRRQYGSGGVSQRAVDGLWIGTIEAGYTQTGSRRRLTVSAKTEPECKRKLRDKRLQLERDGAPEAGTSTRATVKTWADQWIEQKSHTVRPKTWATHHTAVTRWIVPTIGHKRLSSLTPADMDAVAAAQRKAGLTASPRRTHTVLKLMLSDALIAGHQVPPRVLAVKGPSKPAGDREAMTTPEAVAVLNVAATLPDASRWVAALLQGVRQGECLGLTWDAVDLERGLMDISWQLQPLPYLDRKAKTFRVPENYEHRHLEGAWHLVRPKTSKGKRIIPLVPWMASALAAWQEVAPASPYGLVWPRLDGRPVSAKIDTEEWHALQVTAGVGHSSGRYYHLHEARHTTATLLMEAGVAPEVITAILGHSSYVTSRGYMHVEQTFARAALEQVAASLQLGK